MREDEEVATEIAPETATLPLDAWHRAKDARMVEFAGYWMPIQYEGIMAEHLWVREYAGLFDVIHMGQLALSGDDVAAALETLGLAVASSQTNFLFFDCGGPATGTAEMLRQRGILIKAWMEPPFGNHARVTMGTPEENDLFLGALQQIRESR